MKLAVQVTFLALTFGFWIGSVQAQSIPSYVSAAVGDQNRPIDDRKADTDRRPAECIAFAGVKPGDVVLELLGTGGYYTRLLSRVVGPKGHVYTTIPDVVWWSPKFALPVQAIAISPHYANVTTLVQPAGTPKAPGLVDMVWTSDNYHDFHNPPVGADHIDALNKAIFDTLKPGGIYLVLDHVGSPGTGITQTNTLHRIDSEAAKREILRAGFQFVGESKALHRESDDHAARSTFKDDQFIFKFRKPS